MSCGSERCFAAEVTDSALMIGRVCADKAEGRLRCDRAAITITRWAKDEIRLDSNLC